MPIDYIALTPRELSGIPVALIGAVFLAIGTQFQHHGVARVESGAAASGSGLSVGQLFRLVRQPSWVLGTVLLGLAIVLQLTSLLLAPLTVVQPLGAVALVITSFVNARVSKIKLDRATLRAIAFCVGGVGLFVGVAAFTASPSVVGVQQLVTVLIILAAVLAVFTTTFVLFRKKFTPIHYIIGAGILFGFVATLAKVVLERVSSIIADGSGLSSTDLLTAMCILGLLVAGLFGSYLVQTAHATGPPDLVVAGLTVIDPIVGVTIGIAVLHEAAGAPAWAGFAFVIAGVIAVYGVFQLATHHPDMERTGAMR